MSRFAARLVPAASVYMMWLLKSASMSRRTPAAFVKPAGVFPQLPIKEFIGLATSAPSGLYTIARWAENIYKYKYYRSNYII